MTINYRSVAAIVTDVAVRSDLACLAACHKATAAQLAGFVETDKKAVGVIPFRKMILAKPLDRLILETTIHGEAISKDVAPPIAAPGRRRASA